MKSIALFTFFLSISFCLSSCKEDSSETAGHKAAEAPMPDVLLDSESEIKSFYKRSGSNLVEELYQELLSESAELRKLEEDWKKMEEKKEPVFEGLENYTQKNENYIQSARSYSGNIQDSLLQKRIQALVEANEKSYKGRVKEFDLLKSQIRDNDISLDDQYSAMKIILTLPVMERYQKEKLPGNEKEFKEIIQQQKRLIERMSSFSSGK